MVGVEDDPGDLACSAAGADGSGEGVEAQLGAEMVGDRPAEQAARAGVDDGGEEQPALIGWDVGGVTDPQLVELVAVELASDQIGRRDLGGVGDGGPYLATAAATLEVLTIS